jgi:hypothetical protein
MVIVNAVQAFDAVMVDDVWVTETVSAKAFAGDSSIVAARSAYDRIEVPFPQPICYGTDRSSFGM